MKQLAEMSASELRTACEQMLRACALCGHARVDHEHSHTERTWCSVDMGAESHDPCPCAAYEVQP